MKLVQLFFLLSLLSGCSGLLGVRTNGTRYQTKTIINQFQLHHIPLQNRFLLKDSSYTEEIKKDVYQFIETNTDEIKISTKKQIAKDNLQPVQIRYFNANGKQIFKLVNCYVSGSRNWNANGYFNTFPPKVDIERLNHFEYDLNFFLRHISDTSGNQVFKENLPNAKYYALVFWNDVAYKMSNNLIETIQQYHQQNVSQDIFTLFVNNHNSVIRMIESQTKSGK